ncbi:THO complex subunit 4B [Carica papaya]|uniref:THO complex subunit 4B n=1 Tax=Carica papaya TaxID=3649 RepID=UPI000B8CC83A|nr:THO complex subunit 4B [Carica papaya]
MANRLDMSLDDIINSSKKSDGSNMRGRGSRGSVTGPSHRFSNRAAYRTAPYPVQAPYAGWQYDTFMEDAGGFMARVGGPSSIESGTKLYISNLDYGVSNEDIKELFSEIGDLKRYAIHYDRSGRSKGTAEVVFSRWSEALAAVKRYDNVQLDGKPMKIDIVGPNIMAHSVLPSATNGMYVNRYGAARRGRGRGNGMGQPRVSGRGTRRGRQVRGYGEKISAEDLDADLDKYHKEAMETN